MHAVALFPGCVSDAPKTHLKAVVRPRTELHFAALIVERKPGDVDFARRLEDAGRNIQAAAVVAHHHVRRIRPVEALVGAATARRTIVCIRINSGMEGVCCLASWCWLRKSKALYLD